MPSPRASAEQVEQVREFLTNYEGDNDFLTGVSNYLQQRGYITTAQFTAVARSMSSMAQAARQVTEAFDQMGDTVSTILNHTPADADGCARILNGVYTLDDGTEHITYRIHTVRQGSLQGKRIIKKQNNYGQFEGFAFLTMGGTVKVWRRYEQDVTRGSRFIGWAHKLLEILNNDVVDQEIRRGVTTHHVDGWTVSVSTRCRRCNRDLTTPTSIEHGIGPECEAREDSENRTEAADHRGPSATMRFVDEVAVADDFVARGNFEQSAAGWAQGQQINSRAQRCNPGCTLGNLHDGDCDRTPTGRVRRNRRTTVTTQGRRVLVMSEINSSEIQ